MFRENIDLKQFSSYKIGGPARYFFDTNDINGLTAAVYQANEMKVPIFVLAGGTNLLIKDSGFPGVVIKPDFDYIKFIQQPQFPYFLLFQQLFSLLVQYHRCSNPAFFVRQFS